MNDLTQEFINLFYKVNKEKMNFIKRDSFSISKIAVLFYLIKNKVETLNPKDLSDILNLSKSSITSILNNLEESEYIKRSIDLCDRRKIKIEILEKGQLLLSNKNDILYSHIDKVIRKIGIDDSKELIRIINKILKEV